MTIYESIIAAMADIEPIAKSRKNEKQNFNFRGIDDIMNDLQPILKRHGLFVVPFVKDVQRQEIQSKNGGTLLYSIATMEYTMYASDGSFIKGATIGEGMDSGDKASNKAMAVALKYFLLQTFCIPTEDAKDPDADSYTVAPNKNAETAKREDEKEKAKAEYFKLINAVNEVGEKIYDDAWVSKWNAMLREKGLRATIAELKKDQGIA